MKEVIYDQWLPYVEYEKYECDVKLHDGTVVLHCWPNAGKFNTLCADSIDAVHEEDVAEIRYTEYYVKDSCTGNCNGEERTPDSIGTLDAPDHHVLHPRDVDVHPGDMVRNMPGMISKPRKLPYERVQPKVGRNSPCPCGSGKKHKKCCLVINQV